MRPKIVIRTQTAYTTYHYVDITVLIKHSVLKKRLLPFSIHTDQSGHFQAGLEAVQTITDDLICSLQNDISDYTSVDHLHQIVIDNSSTAVRPLKMTSFTDTPS